ncbi:MAG: hypothetical protein KGJ90_05910 [Patescibacteria group bacterium]|nr:hypothetical protein [Patescibacteria group bacterium]
MQTVPNMVDMKREPIKDEEGNEYPGQNLYPYGLAICLEDVDLDKLDLDDDVEVGDMIHFHAMAKVSSISTRDSTEGAKKRVELQITHLSAEDEDLENEEDEAKEDVMSRAQKKMYGS